MKIDEFYNILKGTIVTRAQNQKCMILGDFNAYPEFSKQHSCVSERHDFSREGEANHNVEKFIELICSEKLSVLNTWFFQSTMKRRYTHQSFDKSKKPRIIDYILVPSWAKKICPKLQGVQNHTNTPKSRAPTSTDRTCCTY